MKIANLFFAALGAVAVATSAPAESLVSTSAPTFFAADLGVAWEAPASYIEGEAFNVTISYTVGSKGVQVEAWRLNAGAFKLGNRALGERSKGQFFLAAGTSMEITFDLGPDLVAAGATKAFDLSCEGGEDKSVQFFQLADKAINFIDPEGISTKDLANYKVLMTTTQGDMLMNMYPHLAPNHVRNFLDLSHTGFYNGVVFHRVMPGFMIQGGDPTGTGTGNGPRMLDSEFSNEPHVPGILSMARMGQDMGGVKAVNSASCQFFVMHSNYPSLNNQYSVFGKLESGFEVVDAIVSVPTRGTAPIEPQKIISAKVIYAPSK